MGVKGFQEFWIAGARVYIEKELADGSYGPLLDLGVVQQANPTISPEVVQLYDADSGIRSVVDEAVSSIDESYDVQCSNMNMDNLSLMFMAGDPETYTRLAEARAQTHTVYSGRLCKIKNANRGDAAEWGLTTIDGVYARNGTLSADVVSGMNSELKTITLDASAGNLTAIYTAGFRFIMTSVNMDDLNNAGTYTVASSSFGSATVITVEEDIASDEIFGGTAGGTIKVVGGGGVYAKGTDWDIHSLERGIIQIKPDGNIDSGGTGQSVGISYTVSGLTGERLVKPQSLAGVVRARLYLVYSRDNFGRQTVREADCSITPNGANIQATDFSDMTLTFRILSDLRNSEPAGRLLSFTGSEPSLSEESDFLP